MTAIVASRPPASETKRLRMTRSRTLSSAPPMTMTVPSVTASVVSSQRSAENSRPGPVDEVAYRYRRTGRGREATSRPGHRPVSECASDEHGRRADGARGCETGAREARGGPTTSPAARDLPAPRPAPDPGDGAPHHHVRVHRGRNRRPRRTGRRRRAGVLGGCPDLAQWRRSLPPDGTVPALRLRPVDAADLRAVGALAVGRRLVRLARRDDPRAPLDDRMGLPPAAPGVRRRRPPARLPDRR